MFAVNPKRDCPHLANIDLDGIFQRINQGSIKRPCSSCRDETENWMCLECEGIFCSRYVNSHMVEHAAELSHKVALSFSDASFWCYECDSYIDTPMLGRIARKLGSVKFPAGVTVTPDGDVFAKAAQSEPLPSIAEVEDEPVGGKPESKLIAPPLPPHHDEEAEGSDGKLIPDTNPVNDDKFTFDHLAQGLRAKQFRKIAFLTGAGISVAAGIPDFRTPGTGLYSKVAELGLPYPEAIFSLDYLFERPRAFFSVANGFLTHKAQPVRAHYFMRKVADERMLLMAYTQNIDGLELDAGVPISQLVQAHGHMRSARCCACKASVPMEEFYSHVAREEVLYCTACGDTEEGIVKPDIVFFGENLPKEFFRSFNLVSEADLVIVMGTSLQVWPFAGLLQNVPDCTPLVLINRENPGVERADESKFLFLPGDIEPTVQRICEACGWGEEVEQMLATASCAPGGNGDADGDATAAAAADVAVSQG